MNPQTPSTPNPSPERPVAQPGEQIQPTVEQLELSATPKETPTGLNAGAATGAVPPPLTASDVAAAIAQMPTATPGMPTVTANPQSAADQDVIETEWVDQAEATIAKTAGDPHAEEEAVEALQVDYLKKRYGHNVKSGSQDA